MPLPWPRRCSGFTHRASGSPVPAGLGVVLRRSTLSRTALTFAKGASRRGPSCIMPRGPIRTPNSLRLPNRVTSNGFLFSSAMTVPDVAACLAAVDVLEESTELVDRLWDNARYFKAEMRRLGFDTGLSTTPITPIMLGEAPWHSSSAVNYSRTGCLPCRSVSPPCPRVRRASG